MAGEHEGADSVDMTALRAAYKTTIGKVAFHGWDADTLRAKMAEAAVAPKPEPDQAPVPPAPPPPAEPPAEGVKVMLLCEHVYLPADPTQADWADSTDTKKYDGETSEGRRTKLTVHATLANFLQQRKQAEIL